MGNVDCFIDAVYDGYSSAGGISSWPPSCPSTSSGCGNSSPSLLPPPSRGSVATVSTAAETPRRTPALVTSTRSACEREEARSEYCDTLPRVAVAAKTACLSRPRSEGDFHRDVSADILKCGKETA